jgi:hypothetical protein
MEHARPLGHHQKTKSMNHGYRSRRRDKTKSIDNLFSNIIDENFLNLDTQVQEPYKTPNFQDQKRNMPYICL